MSTDSEENFNYNYEKYPVLFQKYKDNPIIYRINSHGFRSDFEFRKNSKKKVDIYLGCSHTQGIGHYIENTWPHLMSKHTGNAAMNLSMASTGTMFDAYNLLKYVDMFDVQNVFHFSPIYARYDYLSTILKGNKESTRLFTYSPTYTDGPSPGIPYTKEYQDSILLDDRYIFYNHMSNIMSIRGICAERKISYFHRHSNPGFHEPSWVIKKDSRITVDYSHLIGGSKAEKDYIVARDGIHEPVKFQTVTYRWFKRCLDLFPEGKIENINYKNIIYPKTDDHYFSVIPSL